MMSMERELRRAKRKGSRDTLTAHVVDVVFAAPSGRDRPPLDDFDGVVLAVVREPLALDLCAHLEGKPHGGRLSGKPRWGDSVMMRMHACMRLTSK